MDTLVIDSATEACSVALVRDGVMIAGEWRMLRRGHAEQLVPMIAALPGKGRAGTIAVARGPGSFTGVRVGLAAARALALAWGADLAGYSTMALLAAQAREAMGAQPVTVATSGGHGEWFVQRFDADGLSLTALASLGPEQAATWAAAWAGGTGLVAGSQAEALVARAGTGTALELWSDARGFPLLPRAAIGPDTTPLYGRAPDARLPGGKQAEAQAAAN